MSKRKGLSRTWQYIGLAVLAVVTIVAVIGSLTRTPPVATPEQSFQPAAQTPTPTEEEPPVVAFIGDSYTAGAFSTSGGFVAQFGAAKPWEVHNLGVGGTGYAASQSTTGGMNACGEEQCLGYIDVIPQAVEVGADVVIVSGGRNEATVPTDVQAQTVQAFYNTLRDALPDAKIIAFNPVWGADPAPDSVTAMADMVRESVKSVGGSFAANGQPLEGHPEYMSPDGVHPNDAGYEALFEAKLEAVESIL